MDNIVLMCKRCNSSKRDMDLLEWYSERVGRWPLPYVFAYYLKHVYFYAVEHNLMDKTSEDIDSMSLSFKYEYIPLNYPQEYLNWLRSMDIDHDSKPDDPNAYQKKFST